VGPDGIETQHGFCRSHDRSLQPPEV
jgi:hypothetical protein